MAAPLTHLPAVKLPAGPSPLTAEQRYWRSFRSQLQIPSPSASPITHISVPPSLATSSSSSGSGSGSSSNFAKLGAFGAAARAGTGAAAAAGGAGAGAGGHLFAVTTGMRVQLFSARTRKLVKTIARFDDAARSGDVRRDGRVLAAGDDAGTLQVFDVHSRAILKTWRGQHRQPVWTVRWAPGGGGVAGGGSGGLTTLMSTSDDRTVRLWDLTAEEATAVFYGHTDYVRTGAFLPSGGGGASYGAEAAAGGGGGGGGNNLLVSGSYDGTVRIWDARVPSGGSGGDGGDGGGGGGGRAVMTFKHQAPVECVLPLPSGTTVLAAAGNRVAVLDLVAGKPLQLLRAHQKTVTALCLAAHGTRVLAGALDGHLKVFETAAWNVVAGSKYPSPILAISVVAGPSALTSATASGSAAAAAAAAAAARTLRKTGAPGGVGAGADGLEDRHLVVGMQSGLLSIRTRSSRAEQRRAAKREQRMQALLAGTADEYERQQERRQQKKKRGRGWEKRFRGRDFDGEGADIVIEGRGARRKRLEKWEMDLHKGRYALALDQVLDKSHKPTTVLTLLAALRHRSALRAALQGRDEAALQPVLRWVTRHLPDPRFVAAAAELGRLVVELYAAHLGGGASPSSVTSTGAPSVAAGTAAAAAAAGAKRGAAAGAVTSPELDRLVKLVHARVRKEVERAQQACKIRGMLDLLIMSTGGGVGGVVGDGAGGR